MDEIYTEFLESTIEEEHQISEQEEDVYYIPSISWISIKAFIRDVTKWIWYLKEDEKLVAEKILLKIITRRDFLAESCLLIEQLYLNLEKENQSFNLSNKQSTFK